MYNVKAFFESVRGNTYPYSCALEYPHGKMQTICVIRFREREHHENTPIAQRPLNGPYRDEVDTIITFSDGYEGRYTFDAMQLFHYFQINDYKPIR